jgi:hypothetical protein
LQAPWRGLRSIVGSSADFAAFQQASDQLILGYVQKHRRPDRATVFGKPPVKRLCLCEIPRESVQYRSSLGVRLFETGEHELRHNIVGHKIAVLHGGIRRSTTVLAQQVATRDMRQTERSAQQGGLSALACARAAKQQDELRVKLTEVALHDRVY